MTRRALLVAAVAAGVVTIPALALAHHADQPDPDDTPGFMDVAQVRLAHKDDRPKWTVVTYRGWTARSMWDRGYALVRLDTRGTSVVDYYVLVRSTGRQLEGLLFRDYVDRRDRLLGRVPVWRPDRRSLRVTVPLGLLSVGAERTSYWWSVLTMLTSPSCPRTCFDSVPDAGSVEQPLPSPSPTPSPTASPSVSG